MSQEFSFVFGVTFKFSSQSEVAPTRTRAEYLAEHDRLYAEFKSSRTAWSAAFDADNLAKCQEIMAEQKLLMAAMDALTNEGYCD